MKIPMPYEEFPQIPAEHIARCPAAAYVADELDTIHWVGRKPDCEHGTLHDWAIQAIRANCNPENCVLGGLERVQGEIEGRRQRAATQRQAEEEARSKIVYVERKRESFWGNDSDDGGSLFGD